MRGRSDPQLSSPVFVGREPEAVELRQGLAHVLAGTGRLFLISGEPGIGKTRLAEELGKEARGRGARVVWGRCWDGEGAPAFWPWTQIFRAAVGDANAERLDLLTDADAAHVVSLVPGLASSRGSSALPRLRALASVEPAEARFRLFDSAARLLKEIANTAPLVLVLDDLQQADQSSLLMLRFIVRGLKEAPILILGTFREAEVRASPALSRLISEIAGEGRQIVLGGFSQSELAVFVEQRLGIAPGASLLAALMQLTAGNPLFVDSVLRMLIAERKELNGELLSPRDFKVPDAVAETVRRRLSFLPESARAILSIGAVCGQEFEFDCLREVSCTTGEALIAVLDEARRDGLLYSVLTGNLRYRFAHDLIRATIYVDVPAAKRIELHWQIAQTLERINQADLTAHFAEIAHHYRESVAVGSPAKAIDYSIQAGEAALAVFAYEEARHHWQAAVALMERYEADSSRRVDLLHKLGKLTYEVIDYAEGIACFDDALNLCRQRSDNRRIAILHLALGRAKTRFLPQANIWNGLNHYRAAEALIDRNDLDSLGQLYHGRTLADFDAMLIDEGLDASARALKIYKEVGDKCLWTVIAAHRARHLMMRGRLREATALLYRVQQMAPAIPDPEVSRDALAVAAWYYMVMRAPQEASRLFMLAIERPGLSKLQRQRKVEFLALTDYLRGDLASARERSAKMPSFLARIVLREGDWERALELLHEQLQFARMIGNQWSVFNSLNHILHTLYITGEFEQARGLLPTLLEAYGPKEQFCEMRTRPTAALLALEFGGIDEASMHLDHCRRIVREGEDWLGWMGSVACAEAALAAATNRMANAADSFDRSMQILQQFGLVWDAADTLHLWGRVLLRTGAYTGALEKLDGAIEVYRRHGAGQRWIERVEADRRRALDTTTRQVESRAQARATIETSCFFYQENDHWLLVFSGRATRLRDAKGFHYIAHLLRHPGVEVAATDLAGSNSHSISRQVTTYPNAADFDAIHADLGDAGPQLDTKAKADYAQKIRELHEELDEAERLNDLGRAALIRRQIEALTEQLKAATGLRGDRRVASHIERARSTVSKRIRFAIMQIQKHDRQLASYLTGSIRTGYNCVYLPKEKIEWQL